MRSSPTTLEQQALQASFNRACAGILEQGCLAADPDGCYMRYRRQDGSTIKCVIGQILTDDQMNRYNLSDSASVANFPEELIEEMIPGVAPERAEMFMSSLQKAHDTLYQLKWAKEDFAAVFKESANRVAKDYGLKGLE